MKKEKVQITSVDDVPELKNFYSQQENDELLISNDFIKFNNDLSETFIKIDLCTSIPPFFIRNNSKSNYSKYKFGKKRIRKNYAR